MIKNESAVTARFARYILSRRFSINCYVAIMDKLDQVASGVVLYWHQGNGDLAKRIDSLNDAVKMARLKAKFVQQDGVAGWVGRDAALAKEFRQKVEQACIQGWVEREIAGAKGIIRTYRNIPLWKRLLRWLRSST